jgi:signal transduction histidine kinase
MPKSIRWRLPLSYAFIALLVTLSLGLVLLITLRGHYRQQELEYLENNARAIGSMMADLSQLEVSSEELQSQLRSFSFLSQTRVRVLNAGGQVVADSGLPQGKQVAALPLGSGSPIMTIQHTTVTTSTITEDGSTSTELETERTYLVVVRDIPEETSETARPISPTVLVNVVKPLQDSMPAEPGEQSLAPAVHFMPASGTPYGFRFDGGGGSDGFRSNLVVRHPFRSLEGELLGYVELSQGPAYGRQVLESVVRGWAIASVVAVLLAVGVGWLVSHRISTPLLTIIDVTARMAGGDLSARAEIAGQDEFGVLARSFNQMADQVEGTVDALRRFVADAAHEVHTPLTALRTNLELAPQDEHIRRAQVQAERLAALTRGLLDLSRVEGQRQPQAEISIDLGELLQDVSEPYASRAEQAELAFELTLPREPVVIEGRPAQVRQALANLLDNAIKFTPRAGEVRVQLYREEGHAVLSVEDTGIGIPPQDLPHVFERFHRGRNAAAYPGSGLGLAVVRAVAEAHGGCVEAENTVQGTRFTVHLPLRA